MATKAFDSLSVAREPEASGIEAGQAAAIANQLRAVASPHVPEVATKTDVAQIRAEFYRALLPQAGAIIAATVALVKLIPARDR